MSADDDDRPVPRRHGHGHADDVMAQTSGLLGYDVRETRIIEANAEFHARAVDRLATTAKRIPAEKIFGPLDDVQ